MLKVLKEKGYRLTRTRQEIIKILLNNPKDHISAGDLYKRLLKQGISCDLATVYRNLNLLSSLGLIHKTNFQEPHAHFEYSHRHEIHLLCESCGKITEVDANVKIKLPQKFKFQTRWKSIVIIGLCPKCQEVKR